MVNRTTASQAFSTDEFELLSDWAEMTDAATRCPRGMPKPFDRTRTRDVAFAVFARPNSFGR